MQDTSKADGLLTRKEAEKLLKISKSSLRKYTKDGLITSLKIGGRLRYRRTDLEALIVENSK